MSRLSEFVGAELNIELKNQIDPEKTIKLRVPPLQLKHLGMISIKEGEKDQGKVVEFIKEYVLRKNFPDATDKELDAFPVGYAMTIFAQMIKHSGLSKKKLSELGMEGFLEE